MATLQKHTLKELFPYSGDSLIEFRCSACKKTFLGEEVILEPLVNMVIICGSKWAMHCPHCNYASVTGFNLASKKRII